MSNKKSKTERDMETLAARVLFLTEENKDLYRRIENQVKNIESQHKELFFVRFLGKLGFRINRWVS